MRRFCALAAVAAMALVTAAPADAFWYRGFLEGVQEAHFALCASALEDIATAQGNPA